jgi:hypothetical protein
VGDEGGQLHQKEQERKQREDKVIAKYGRTVGDPMILAPLVQAFEENSPTQPRTMQFPISFRFGARSRKRQLRHHRLAAIEPTPVRQLATLSRRRTICTIKMEYIVGQFDG